ncbi:hypothetical protein [Streptomyces triticiradicis]|uniref:ATP-binding protein n=1 Tax=Streptomyces triticiradicis TaxID=2651189 RepID=A0A7J5DBM6_9ACTN|nr:hypothetical protein [Streptomyces triticiradicis]KAB1986221.1 hypothetical protein F8144_24295 [Streptomyces triticiradicis]
MKFLKAAAVVAGSMAVAGTAAPAFAAGASGITPSGLNGALENVTSQRSLSAQDVLPLQQQSNALDTENKGSVLNGVNGATKKLNTASEPAQLLGGLPLQK